MKSLLVFDHFCFGFILLFAKETETSVKMTWAKVLRNDQAEAEEAPEAPEKDENDEKDEKEDMKETKVEE